MNKDVFNFGYLGDEKIEITANEFNLIKVALEQGISATQTVTYPEVFQFLNKETGKAVKNPSKDDLALGKVIQVTDKESTFSRENAKLSYDGSKLAPEMLYAQELILEIHTRNVEAGIAKSAEELKKANELTPVKQ